MPVIPKPPAIAETRISPPDMPALTMEVPDGLQALAKGMQSAGSDFTEYAMRVQTLKNTQEANETEAKARAEIDNALTGDGGFLTRQRGDVRENVAENRKDIVTEGMAFTDSVIDKYLTSANNDSVRDTLRLSLQQERLVVGRSLRTHYLRELEVDVKSGVDAALVSLRASAARTPMDDMPSALLEMDARRKVAELAVLGYDEEAQNLIVSKTLNDATIDRVKALNSMGETTIAADILKRDGHRILDAADREQLRKDTKDTETVVGVESKVREATARFGADDETGALDWLITQFPDDPKVMQQVRVSLNNRITAMRQDKVRAEETQTDSLNSAIQRAIIDTRTGNLLPGVDHQGAVSVALMGVPMSVRQKIEPYWRDVAAGKQINTNMKTYDGLMLIASDPNRQFEFAWEVKLEDVRHEIEPRLWQGLRDAQLSARNGNLPTGVKAGVDQLNIHAMTNQLAEDVGIRLKQVRAYPGKHPEYQEFLSFIDTWMRDAEAATGTSTKVLSRSEWQKEATLGAAAWAVRKLGKSSGGGLTRDDYSAAFSFAMTKGGGTPPTPKQVRDAYPELIYRARERMSDLFPGETFTEEQVRAFALGKED